MITIKSITLHRHILNTYISILTSLTSSKHPNVLLNKVKFGAPQYALNDAHRLIEVYIFTR